MSRKAADPLRARPRALGYYGRPEDVRKPVSIRLNKGELQDLDRLVEAFEAERVAGDKQRWWSSYGKLGRGDVVTHLIAQELKRRGMTDPEEA